MNQLEQIQQMEQTLIQAQRAGDADTLAGLLANNLLFVGPNGGLYSKAMDLEAHRSRTLHLTDLVAQEPRIELFPQLAIVTVVVDLQGFSAGQPIGGRYRYLRVWAEREGTWQAVAGSCCPVQL